MQTTRFAWDAKLPLIRPDSFVQPFNLTDEGWGLWTPSCFDESNENGSWILAVGTEEELLLELNKVGRPVKNGNKWTVEAPLADPKWWIHRAEDGMIPEEILVGKV